MEVYFHRPVMYLQGLTPDRGSSFCIMLKNPSIKKATEMQLQNNKILLNTKDRHWANNHIKLMSFEYLTDIMQVKLIFSNQTRTSCLFIPSHTENYSWRHGLGRFPLILVYAAKTALMAAPPNTCVAGKKSSMGQSITFFVQARVKGSNPLLQLLGPHLKLRSGVHKPL